MIHGEQKDFPVSLEFPSPGITLVFTACPAPFSLQSKHEAVLHLSERCFVLSFKVGCRQRPFSAAPQCKHVDALTNVWWLQSQRGRRALTSHMSHLLFSNQPFTVTTLHSGNSKALEQTPVKTLSHFLFFTNSRYRLCYIISDQR